MRIVNREDELKLTDAERRGGIYGLNEVLKQRREAMPVAEQVAKAKKAALRDGIALGRTVERGGLNIVPAGEPMNVTKPMSAKALWNVIRAAGHPVDENASRWKTEQVESGRLRVRLVPDKPRLFLFDRDQIEELWPGIDSDALIEKNGP